MKKLLLSAAAADPWPELVHPRDARIEPIGEQIRLNGVPMRIARVLSPAPTAVVLSHYQQVLGVSWREPDGTEQRHYVQLTVPAKAQP